MHATGFHVFAGGFTQGVSRIMDVNRQIEVHSLGRATVEQRHGIPHGKGETEGAEFLYGNPRCTGFSCVTCGMSEASRDKPTIDARQFVSMGLETPGIKVFCWESVQQAYKSPLIKQFEERCIKEGWSVDHIFCNSASWGNAQHRRRYFFVGTKIELDWSPPPRPVRHTTIRDVIEKFEGLRAPLYHHASPEQIDRGDYVVTTTGFDEIYYEMLRPGENVNAVWKKRPEQILKIGNDYLRDIGLMGQSDMPYGMHCERRLPYDAACPVIYSGSDRWIHPTLNRFLTIRELAELMGWEWCPIPVNNDAVYQIGKGIVPDIGEWIAENVKSSLDANITIAHPSIRTVHHDKYVPNRSKEWRHVK